MSEVVNEMDALNLCVLGTYWIGAGWCRGGDGELVDGELADNNLEEFLGDNASAVLGALGLPQIAKAKLSISAVIDAAREAGKAGFIVVIEDRTHGFRSVEYVYTEDFGSGFQSALRAFHVEGAVAGKKFTRLGTLPIVSSEVRQ